MQNQKILRVAPVNTLLQDKLSKELGISRILAQILVNRGLNKVDKAGEFLNASPRQLLDPFSFRDMPKAVDIIKKASKNKERVMIFGDYDVDGISAIALLKRALKKIGLEALHYIPHRIKEGYGLNKEIIRLAKQKNIKLLITADCGISNRKEIEELRRQNIKTIITDHHEPAASELPVAASIINPKLKTCGYKYRDLAGVGVAYKLCEALSGSMLLEDLDLVSLGTIADAAPLTGENRVIAKEGLLKLSQTENIGLKVLIENAGIKDRKFNSNTVTFILGPRINASGRIDTAETSLDLLMSQTQEEADKLAKIIEANNRQRQRIENKILEEAQDLINREINFKKHKIIVIAKEDWHHGVLGIVASKLANRFYRPTIVISLNEDLCKGSGRSIKNFHLFQALLDCKEFLNTFGGHSHAAGLVIAKESIEDFKHSINRLACERLSLEDLIPSLDIDIELGLSDLNEDVVYELEKLEPIGAGNPEALFYTKSLKLKGQARTLGRDTLKFWASDGNRCYQAIGFGMGSLKDNLHNAKYFDLVYTPRIDNWQGFDTVLLEIRDIFFR